MGYPTKGKLFLTTTPIIYHVVTDYILMRFDYVLSGNMACRMTSGLTSHTPVHRDVTDIILRDFDIFLKVNMAPNRLE